MPFPRSIGMTSLFVMVSTASVALMQWVIMAIIARVEGPGQLGNYAFAQSLITPASYLAWLAIRQEYLVLRGGPEVDSDYLALRIWVPAVGYAILLAFVALVYRSWELTCISLGVFVLKYGEGFYDLAYGRLQRNDLARQIAIISSTRVALTLPIFALIYWRTQNAMLGLLVVAAIWLAGFYAQRSRLWSPSGFADLFAASRRVVARRLQLAGSLIPVALTFTLMALVTNVPRLLVGNILGPADLGYFAAAVHFLAMGAVVVGSVGHAILPVLAKAQAARDSRSFWSVLLGVSAILQGVCLIGVAIAAATGSSILALIYGPAFRSHGDLLVWAAAAAGPVYAASIFANGCYAANLRGGLFWLQAAGLVSTIAITLVLTPALGTSGAFLGMSISSVLQIAVAIVWLSREPRARTEQEAVVLPPSG